MSRPTPYRFPKKYTGIPDDLKAVVLARDNFRCRWCGATNRGTDLHHIEYRVGVVSDREDNLITLCRQHHGFVHGTPAGNGDTITKAVAQQVLQRLVEVRAATGLALWRHFKADWVRQGRCTKHGLGPDECLDCSFDPQETPDGHSPVRLARVQRLGEGALEGSRLARNAAAHADRAHPLGP